MKEFFDDGVSGAHFNRPHFDIMLKEIKAKRIQSIIVKDAYVKNRLKFFEGLYLSVLKEFG